MKLYKKIVLQGQIELLTGIHIGDSGDNVEIGGVDKPVVRRKDNNQPYIPGSSLKGKMRSLLDVAHGQSDTTRKPDHKIGKLFGALGRGDEGGIPSRLIVRDASMHQDSAESFSNSEFTDMPYTEIKFENSIDRVQGRAINPRQFERVPAGARFAVEFVINIFGEDEHEAAVNEKEHLELFQAGIKLLEDDYLGGSGSRGYGQVKFHLNAPIHKPVETYLHA
jgi:CRISPR-associated protein Csm3